MKLPIRQSIASAFRALLQPNTASLKINRPDVSVSPKVSTMNTTAIARLAAILSPVAAAVAAALAIGATGATGTAATPAAGSAATKAVHAAEGTGSREHWYYDYTKAPVVQGDDDMGNVPGTGCRDCVRDRIEDFTYGVLLMPAGTGEAYYDNYCANGTDEGPNGVPPSNGLWDGPYGYDISAVNGVDSPTFAAGTWGYGDDVGAIGDKTRAFFAGGVCSRLAIECLDGSYSNKGGLTSGPTGFGSVCVYQQATDPCPNDPNVTTASLASGVYHYGFLADVDGDDYCDEDTYALVCTLGPADGLGGVPAPGISCSNVFGDDCEDAYSYISPIGTEVCDTYSPSRDEDCDGYADDADTGGASGKTNFYVDTDNDNYGAGTAQQFCDEPALYAPVAGDCQNGDAGIYPGALETCDNIPVDNDCSQGGTGIDKTAINMQLYYLDTDGDNYGTGSGILACSPPMGYAPNGGDCDDSSAAVNPGATEVCDGLNNDCDSYTDEGFSNFDGDGYADCVDTDIDNDGSLNAPDCDDYAADVYPGAVENCANLGVNNDCDAYNDATEAIDSVNYYTDSDNDGYGTGTAFKACSDTSTTAPQAGDCNDGVAGVNPGAAETCDGVDNNCAGGVDEGFTNFDNDSYADCVDGDIDNDGSLNGPDCDDYNSAVYPTAPETCATYGVDNDCDGDLYDAVGVNYHRDADGDGYGNPSVHVVACDQPAGYVANSGDCNDSAPYAWTGRAEICDGYDNNCVGGVDEGVTTRFYRDGDGDTYTGDVYQDACSAPAIPSGGGPWGTTDELDCNDAYATIYPGAVENCANLGVNNDCDAYNDAAEAVDSVNYYTDGDNDGYGVGTAFKACSDTSSTAPRDGDCSDGNPAVNPGAAEVCDGADNDCDTYTDEGFPNFDGDGYADCVDGDIDNDGSLNANDCDDYAADTYPGAPEVCANINIDNDCDLNAMEATDLSVWARDVDNDGYGTQDASQRIKACTAPAGYAPNTDDCNDADRYTYLNAPELCDTYGVDNDCDGDRYDATNPSTWYADTDGDTYGNPSSTAVACTRPSGYVANSGDCNDSASYAWTGRAEICDGYDNNCVNGVDEGVTTTFYRDADSDGFGKASSGTMQRCAAGDGYLSSNTDCNDGDRYVNPSATELVGNGIDDNCDNYELCYWDRDNDGYLDGAGGTILSSNLSCEDAYESPTNSPTGDCSDTDATRRPGYSENCDTINIDNDCDGNATEAENAQRYYRDGDGDGYGAGTVSQVSCTQPSGWVASNTDCDDADRYTSPGAVEVVANGKDNDCDGYEACFVDQDNDKFLPASPVSAETSTDLDCDDAYEGGNSMPRTDGCPEVFALQATVRYFRDADAAGGPDGIGCTDSYVNECSVTPPSGYVATSGDNCCDAYNPDQANCDTDAQGNACDSDDDNDGDADIYDCDDCNRDVYTGAAELCATIGVDNDCDGNVNDATDFQALYVDADGDGFGDRTQQAVKSCAGPNMSTNNGDCNDANAAINPSATEVCDSNVDNDCDGYADDADPQASSITNRTRWYADAEVPSGDSYGDPAVFLDRCSQPAGYVTDNTDQCPTVAGRLPSTWYRDQDIDGYGDPATSTTSCANPSAGGVNWVSNNLDQCPLNQGRLPGTWYRDTDGDGYGAADSYTSSCGQPSGYVANSSDGCPDVYALQAPRTYYRDDDGDGYGTTVTAQFCSTTAPTGYSSNSTDCNDAYATLWTPIRYFADTDGDGCGDPNVANSTTACSLTAPTGFVSNSNDGCPSDPNKCAAGQCGCGTADTDSDGDGYADCVDRTPQLSLVAASPTFSDGYVDVYVQLGAAQPDQYSTGAQMQLAYDTSKLAFVSASVGSATAGPGLFSQEVFESVNATAGTITYGVGVADGQPGTSTARRVAVLRFRLAGDAICSLSNLVQFAVGGSTYLSNQGGTAAITVTTSNLGAITAYSNAAGFVGVPASWTRAADAGVSGSVFANPGVTFVEPCSSGSTSVTLSVTLASGGTSANWPAGGVFPVGTSTVTWSAGGQSVTRTFTVLNHQLMDVTVSLAGAGITPSSRQIRLVAGASTQTVTATVGGSAAPTVIQIQVPIASYSCVQVKDVAHSLSSAPAVSISGVRYVATASLDQGDSNSDNTVDILDFGVYVAAFGPATASAVSNFDGDLFINNVDFSFISFNFFKVGASCPGAGSMGDGGLASGEPRDRISVGELRKLGQGELAIADLNGDGWIDTRDIGLWLQGVRPVEGADAPRDGGNATE